MLLLGVGLVLADRGAGGGWQSAIKGMLSDGEHASITVTG